MALPSSPFPMGPVPGPFLFRFQKNIALLNGNGALGINLATPSDPLLATQLATNQPLTGSGNIDRGELQLRPSPAEKSILFHQGSGNISFSGGANVFGNIARYCDPADLVSALPITDAISSDMFGDATNPDFYYLMLDWGFDVRASGSGKVALAAAGSVEFGAEATSTGGFAVIRRIAAGTPSRDAIQQLLDNWLLPAQVGRELHIALSESNPLPAGTWVVAETQGSLKGRLGVTYGFDFSWLRQAGLGPGGLAGDIALKLQANVSAALSFEVSGKFGIVLSRQPGSEVRLQVFKQRNKGWNFALNLNCMAQPSTDGFPHNADELASAMLGINHQQILRYLQSLENWSKSADPLPDTLARLGAPAALDLVKKLTGLDPTTNFSGAVEKLTSFLKQWTALDQRLSAVLWNLSQGPAATEVMAMSQKIASGTAQDFEDLLNQTLPVTGFLASSQGQFLEALCMGNVLEALDKNEALRNVQARARTCLELMTTLGSGGAATMLSQIQNFLQRNISLDALKNQTFAALEPLLKARLAELLDTTGLTPDHVQKIKDFLRNVEDHANDIYEKALQALNSTYSVLLSAKYSAATSDNELLDVSFDLAMAGTAELLAKAIAGDFTDLLYSDHDGVVWERCVFAHEIQRHAHVDFRMPFYSSSFDEVNMAVASMNFVPHYEDKTVSFTLSASDDVRKIVNSKSGSDSQMALAAVLPASSSRVLVHDAGENMTMSYALKQAIPDMRRSYLQYQAKSYVQVYLPDAFGTKSSFDEWLGDMDKTLDRLGNHGTDVFGNTLLSLEVEVPSAIASAWLNAPSDSKSVVYLEVSRRLQTKLKQLLTFFYFSDPNRFKDLNSASPLIAYASIPPSSAVKLNGGMLTLQSPNDLYWDWMDPDIRSAMLRNPMTRAGLAATLSGIFERLQTLPEMSSTAKFYQPSEVNIGNLLHNCDSGFGARLFQSLLFTEATLVRGTVEAAVEMGKFLHDPKPEYALSRMAKFGADITKTFNAKLQSVYGGDALRPLGSALFIEAALALLGDNQMSSRASAMFQAIVVSADVAKADSLFHMTDYLAGQQPPTNMCLISQALISAAAPHP